MTKQKAIDQIIDLMIKHNIDCQQIVDRLLERWTEETRKGEQETQKAPKGGDKK